jgi:hypothetical protein
MTKTGEWGEFFPIRFALFGYNEKQSFGKLTFDFSKSDPYVAYEIISIDNENINSLILTKSMLTNR